MSTFRCDVRGKTDLEGDKNRALLNVIADNKPDSLQDLARLTGRQASNLSRTLKTLESYGFVELKRDKRKIKPVAKATRFEIRAA